MSDAKPLLQIIHVSDLHVSHRHNDKAAVARMHRLRSACRTSRKLLEFLKIWREGTAGHLSSSERAFDRYLQSQAASDKTWFPDDGSPTPVTWLIDTGDVSAFGDEASINYSLAKHAYWRALLRNCESRCLFGNHDLWTGVNPLFSLLGEDLALRTDIQETMLQRYPLWDRRIWREPLAVAAPGDGPRIEFYALDTNGRAIFDEIKALGEVEEEDLEALCEAIARRSQRPTYRILGTHHPLSFPYYWTRTYIPLLKTMLLSNAAKVMRRLRNDDGADARMKDSPYIHLFLSGHTHLGFPGEKLLDDVAECHQRRLGREQLQLVTGSLMQARIAEQIRGNTALRERKGPASGFAQSRLFAASSQFQVLRFYYEPDRPGMLQLRREVWSRTPLNDNDFACIEEFESTTLVTY
jgi:3',5'-cyclic AMP phosphodiesterase CpdA